MIVTQLFPRNRSKKYREVMIRRNQKLALRYY